ncbi:anti-sigma factor, partial [Stenotrophomonas maltophilia]|uniref:anti-sigma factor n=1 Tax=Stenotrophomonas maltophilia TaxID=40324 RepID=UPI0013DC0005
VEAHADGRIRVVPLQPMAVPEGRTLQVWTRWDVAVGPRSVGLMSAARDQVYQTTGMPVPAANQLYEITLE